MLVIVVVAVAKICVLFLKHGTLDRPQTFVVVLALRNCFLDSLDWLYVRISFDILE